MSSDHCGRSASLSKDGQQLHNTCLKLLLNSGVVICCCFVFSEQSEALSGRNGTILMGVMKEAF